MKNYVVFLGVNKAFLDGLHILLSSYLRNSEIGHLDLFIFTTDLVEEDIKLDIQFTLIQVDKLKYRNLEIENKKDPEFAESASLRLDAIDYLKHKYEYGLYLDCDMIINGSLANLITEFKEDIQVVNNTKDIENYNLIFPGLQPYSDYFNSGFMLVNFKKLNKEISLSELFLKEKKYHVDYDQYFLNEYFYNKDRRFLDYTYNFTIEPVNRNVHDNKRFTALIQAKRNAMNANVVHFTGYPKPWNYTYLHETNLAWPFKLIITEAEYIKDILSKESYERILKIEEKLQSYAQMHFINRRAYY